METENKVEEVFDQSQDSTGSDIFMERKIDLSLKAQVEAVIFASPKPVLIPDIISYLPGEYSPSEIEAVILELQNEYESRKGGFSLEYSKGIGYQFRTVSEAMPIMEVMFSARPKQLSKAALETLAIIAYRQPTTRATVEFIRGVDSGSIIKNLMERNFIKCVGRKEDIGRPMLFGTTDEFLQVFGISSIEELPSLQSFQTSSDIIQEAGRDLEELGESSQVVQVEKIVGDGTDPDLSSGLLVESETENYQTEVEEEQEQENIDIDVDNGTDTGIDIDMGSGMESEDESESESGLD